MRALSTILLAAFLLAIPAPRAEVRGATAPLPASPCRLTPAQGAALAAVEADFAALGATPHPAPAAIDALARRIDALSTDLARCLRPEIAAMTRAAAAIAPPAAPRSAAGAATPAAGIAGEQAFAALAEQSRRFGQKLGGELATAFRFLEDAKRRLEVLRIRCAVK